MFHVKQGKNKLIFILNKNPVLETSCQLYTDPDINISLYVYKTIYNRITISLYDYIPSRKKPCLTVCIQCLHSAIAWLYSLCKHFEAIARL